MYDADCLEKIGANVKFLRTMRKLRQQDVAQTLGISQTHLSNMECGRVKFSLKQLLRLANLFDCQLECFFDPRQAANVAVGGTYGAAADAGEKKRPAVTAPAGGK